MKYLFYDDYFSPFSEVFLGFYFILFYFILLFRVPAAYADAQARG